MFQRSCGRTVGDICGNDMLERAEALVRELGVRPRLQEDARQEVILAMLEGRDPLQAVQRFVDGERSLGLTGGGTRPTVLRLTPEELDRATYHHGISPEDQIIAREDALERLEVAGAVLVGLSRRDRRIVQFIAQGWTHAEIAEHLGVERRAVSRWVAKIQAKSRALLSKVTHSG